MRREDDRARNTCSAYVPEMRRTIERSNGCEEVLLYVLRYAD